MTTTETPYVPDDPEDCELCDWPHNLCATHHEWLTADYDRER